MNYFFTELRKRNKTLYWFGWLHVAAALFCMFMIATTHTQVLGINAWIKPCKFFISSTLYIWTMGWLMFYLNEPKKTAYFNWMAIIVFVFENGYIAWQASRGQQSHFNFSSPSTAIIFSLMGIAISVLDFWTAYICFLFYKKKFPALTPQYLAGIRLGLLLFVVLSISGYTMAAILKHTIGAADGGKGWPLLNWSSQYGDIRIAHFLGMHSLQLLPLFGFYLSKKKGATMIAAGIYFVVTTTVFIIALMGRPLL